MLYSHLHGLYCRVRNKISRTLKRHRWQEIPHQQQVTFFTESYQLFEPLLAGPSTFSPHCVGAEAVHGVLPIIESLGADPYLDFVKGYYRKGLAEFGDEWNYADMSTVLYGICKVLNVQSYLEIGVRRGRSMAVVASMRPHCRIVGFDLWIPDYCGVDNPGRDFVRTELEKVNYRGTVEFVDGNSRKTVPEYFQKHTEAYFDLVTVDGDHSIGGAVRDLKNVIPRIKIGGILVFDDISSYEHPYLLKVWNKLVVNNRRFAAYSFTELGLGVGFAIRRY
jgi:predicted O-methyltransferase YrrM